MFAFLSHISSKTLCLRSWSQAMPRRLGIMKGQVGSCNNKVFSKNL